MTSLVSADYAILTGLARLGRRSFRSALPALKVDGPWGITPKAAGHARKMLREIVALSFEVAGAAGIYPYPNPNDADHVTYAPAWRRWGPDRLAFKFGPISICLAGMSVAGGIDPPLPLDVWQTGDVLVAWRVLVLSAVNKTHLDTLSHYSRLLPWFWLGVPEREITAAMEPLDLKFYFRPPLLAFLEALQPWLEIRWTNVLESWADLKPAGRASIVRAWRLWRDACLEHDRPDLVRGMLRAANSACVQTRWMENLRKQLPAPGAVSFQELGLRELDLLAIGTMLEEMAIFRDQAEQLVYIDETYASATAFKSAVPPEVRDRLRQCSADIGAMGALGRVGGAG